MSDGDTLYDTILGRISAVQREGMVNTARNLPRYLTVGEKRTEAPGRIRPCLPAEVAADGSLLRQNQKGIDFRTLEAVHRQVGGKLL